MLRGVDDLDFFIGDEAVDKPTYATKVGSGDSRPGEWLGGGGGRRSVEGSSLGSGGRGALSSRGARGLLPPLEVVLSRWGVP